MSPVFPASLLLARCRPASASAELLTYGTSRRRRVARRSSSRATASRIFNAPWLRRRPNPFGRMSMRPRILLAGSPAILSRPRFTGSAIQGKGRGYGRSVCRVQRWASLTKLPIRSGLNCGSTTHLGSAPYRLERTPKGPPLPLQPGWHPGKSHAVSRRAVGAAMIP